MDKRQPWKMGGLAMNVYELADKLTTKFIRGSEKQKAADMLRQQAEHINELDALLDKKYQIIKEQKKELEQCKTIIALANIAWKNKFGKELGQ